MSKRHVNSCTTKDELFDLVHQHCAESINDEIYTECANFLFYTSWFEELLFNDKKRQNPKNEIKICKEVFKNIELSEFDFLGEHFCTRYFNQDEAVTKQFVNLRLENESIEKVKNALLGFKEKHIRTADLLYAYIMIIYRFRNNMFHGSKGLINLSKYKEEFTLINHFMFLLIKKIYEIGYKGYNQQ